MNVDYSKSISYIEVYLKSDKNKKPFTVYYQGFDPLLKEQDFVDMAGDWYSEDELELIKVKYN